MVSKIALGLRADPKRAKFGKHMFWIIVFVVIIIASAFLAFRSMKNYAEVLPHGLSYSLYLVTNADAMNLDFIYRIYEFSKELNSPISLERLIRGEDNVFVIYAPSGANSRLQDLGLMEIEDYLDHEVVSAGNSFIWTLISKDQEQKKMLGFEVDSLGKLSQDQGVFLQLVLMPRTNEVPIFQATARILVVDKDPIRRITFAKSIRSLVDQTGQYAPLQQKETTGTEFKNFKWRAFYNDRFILDPESVLSFLQRDAKPALG